MVSGRSNWSRSRPFSVGKGHPNRSINILCRYSATAISNSGEKSWELPKIVCIILCQTGCCLTRLQPYAAISVTVKIDRGGWRMQRIVYDILPVEKREPCIEEIRGRFLPEIITVY